MKRRLSCVLIALLLVLALVLPTPAGAATLDVESDTVTTFSVSSDTVTTVRADWITTLSEILSAILSGLDIIEVFFGDSTYTIDDIYGRLNLLNSRLLSIQGDTEYIEDILDTLSHGSYSIADMVYYIWQELAGDIANALEVLTEEYSYEWSNGTVWSGNLLWWVARAARSLGYSNGTTVYSAGYMLYSIMQSVSALDDTMSYEWSDGTTWSGNFLFWIYRTSQSLAFSPSSSDSIYSAAQLLYYIWQDSSSILDAINELALAIDFDALLEALEDISDAISDNGSDLIDAVESLGDALDDVSELLEDGFDDVSDGFEDVSESLETLTSDSSSIVDSLTSLTDSIDDMSDTLDDISDSVGASDSGLDLWDLIIGAIDTVTLADDLQDLAESVEDTFPLGIVFWVPDFLFVFVADPVAPYFEFDLSAIGGGTIVMDLSMFDDIAVLVCGCVLICYILGLYFSTKKFIFVADDSDG